MAQIAVTGLAEVLDRGILDVEWSLVCNNMASVESSQPPLHYCFLQGANLQETITEEKPKPGGKTLNLNYYMLKGWCGDCLERDRDISDLPLHNLRRTTIDILRWIPGWDRSEFEPYLESDDEDDEEDAELICRPRTIGGVPQ